MQSFRVEVGRVQSFRVEVVGVLLVMLSPLSQQGVRSPLPHEVGERRWILNRYTPCPTAG